MNSHISLPTHAHQRTTVVPATRLVTAGLDRTTEAIRRVGAERPHDPRDHADRADRLSALHARRARWWAVLERVAVADADLPIVYVRAIVDARGSAESDARFWRDSAEDWRARADRRPTSDAASAMSNWHELGVAELGRPHLAEIVGVDR